MKMNDYLYAVQMPWPPGYSRFVPKDYDYASVILIFDQTMKGRMPAGVKAVLGISENDRDLSRGLVFDFYIKGLAVKGGRKPQVHVVDELDQMSIIAADRAVKAIQELEHTWETIAVAADSR
jgi:hypothetical protein